MLVTVEPLCFFSLLRSFGFIAPKHLNYLAFQYFDLQLTWRRLLEKRAVRSRFDIYVFIKHSNIVFEAINNLWLFCSKVCSVILWFHTCVCIVFVVCFCAYIECVPLVGNIFNAWFVVWYRPLTSVFSFIFWFRYSSCFFLLGQLSEYPSFLEGGNVWVYMIGNAII